ncbi:competence protein CoiA family protein, partial [Priestia megaterium]|uniref:competence protein CoiA family protein n=1 Tax=Priestia megaterium TaxID=1404 RepID=UPI002FFE459F
GEEMPRYAYIPYQVKYEKVLKHVDVDEFQGDKVLRVDSTELTVEDINVIHNELNERFFCYSCDTRMILRRPKNRNQHFVHLTRKNCFQAEGLAHASVKKDLYNRFFNRGYQVEMERIFQADKKQVRTDVAVMKEKDILAIEVQASPSIKRSTVAERTNTYSSKDIPTAWVIVLNSFFGEGKYTKLSNEILVKNEDGTSHYEKTMIPFEKPTPFFILTDIPNSFHMLMDAYKYMVSVNHDGHFFLIREKDIHAKGEYEIYRIEQEKVVDVLLATEALNIDYVPEQRATGEQPNHELEHNDGKHPDEWEGEKILYKHNIDFQKAYEEEQEQLKFEEAIDILLIVEETKKRERMFFKKQKIMQDIDAEIKKLQRKQKRIQTFSEKMQDTLEQQEEQIKKIDRVQKNEKVEMLSTMRAYKELHLYFAELITRWEAKADLEEMPVHRLKKAVEILEKKRSTFAVKVVHETYEEVSEIIGSIPNTHSTAVAQPFVNAMRSEKKPSSAIELITHVHKGFMSDRRRCERYPDFLKAFESRREEMERVAEYYFWWENLTDQEKGKIRRERNRRRMG